MHGPRHHRRKEEEEEEQQHGECRRKNVATFQTIQQSLNLHTGALYDTAHFFLLLAVIVTLRRRRRRRRRWQQAEKENNNNRTFHHRAILPQFRIGPVLDRRDAASGTKRRSPPARR